MRLNVTLLARALAMLHATGMTLPDLGPERPGDPTETRQMVERGRTETGGGLSNQVFVIALAVIVVAIVIVMLLLR
jgi:hypothetical protein